MLAQETRNNNGQARPCEAKFRGNAANKSLSLLGDLRWNASRRRITTYAEREE
jgi:hypothetical protein